MVRVGSTPNIITFNSLIDVCAKAGNVEMAEKLWGSMLDSGLEPTSVTYNMILNACAQAHEGQLAERWMESMLEAGGEVRPCIVSYTTVIAGFANTGKFEKAEWW